MNIAGGRFSDMCMYGDKVYTWDHVKKQVVEFVRKNMEWKRQERVVKVRGLDEWSINDTLLVRKSEGNYVLHTLLRVSQNR